jgi:hypothetical protein
MSDLFDMSDLTDYFHEGTQTRRANMKPGVPNEASEAPDRARPLPPALLVAAFVAAIVGALIVRRLLAET